MTEKQKRYASQTTQNGRYLSTGGREKLFSRLDIPAFRETREARETHQQRGLFQ